MEKHDVDRIERELEVSLPEIYREALTNYPVPAFAGTSEDDQNMFWDDAEAIIRYNRQLRAGEEPHIEAWPKRFFALGRDDSGCSDALDLEDPEYGVYWFDRAHVASTETSSPSEEKIGAWISRQVEVMTEYLEELGLQKDSSPEERSAAEKKAQDRGIRGCMIILFCLVFTAIVLYLLRR